MFSRAARSAPQALRKNGCAENAMVGSAIAALIQWNMSRVASAAPDQTATDSSITFIIAKPATPSRISSSRPVRSTCVPASVAASSSCASQPWRVSSSASVPASTPGSASTIARFSVRFTRARRTPGMADRLRSTPAMQAAQWIAGSDSNSCSPPFGAPSRPATAPAAGAAEQAGQAEVGTLVLTPGRPPGRRRGRSAAA